MMGKTTGKEESQKSKAILPNKLCDSVEQKKQSNFSKAKTKKAAFSKSKAQPNAP